ncbi:zinc ribbon domain-containing protein [Clostridium psychrophilum]|uniref:zinc ribbon domain-containing protein n=1 Tax=Clostridium psychrophilum TaxID=132926 RepID=UPI001C0CC4EE|nr:zinc ribbon domain-containing protein [Clostridium psychrophilum]MBU3181834.1 zinc ribbon domain-containing protein [Clostridium psychrophilum]
MADSKLFKLVDCVDIESLGRGIEGFLRDKKNLYAEGMKTPEGYLIQAKQADGWKKFVGMDSAIQVQLFLSGDMVTVNVGSGKWIDKAGAATVGMLIFAPLAVTAAIGAFAQKKLPDEVFTFIEQFLMSGGKNVTISMGANKTLKSNEILCPNCKAPNLSTSKFCDSCGSKLALECPNCKSSVPQGTKFCPECGSSMIIKHECSNCHCELEASTKFCPECGTPNPQ